MIEEPDGALGIPLAVRAANASTEVARLWITDSAASVIVRTGVWDDPAHWGIFLSDVVDQIAASLASDGSVRLEEAKARIVEGLLAEQQSPSG